MADIIVSGVQPTGKLHLGNYLGAMKNWVALQTTYPGQCFFFTADYHAMNEEDLFKNYPSSSLELSAELLALGLNPKKSTLFHQKDVPEVTELAWIFNTLVPVSFLERMTQYKDKAEHAKSINMGLMGYPILQAADIMLYGGTQVPVGEDQIQHVELTRDIARFFNNRFGLFFAEPKPLLTPVKRVMALNYPERKMSKSITNSFVSLDDPPEVVRAKIRSAVTDLGPKPTDGMSPGVENLFTLLREFAEKGMVEKFEREYKNGELKYVQLKDAIAEAIITHFAEFRKKKAELMRKPRTIEKAFALGAKKARKIAEDRMKKIRQFTGLDSKK